MAVAPPVNPHVPTHFLDSGAFSLWNRQVIKMGKRDDEFYDSKEFRSYVDDYAAFVKKYKHVIQVYANVDVIGNPKRSWETQRYLEEEHGLSPIPVVHHGTDLKWLEKYLEKGYDYIGLGGAAKRSKVMDYARWADRAWEIICPGPSHLPVCKVHGFAITSFTLVARYPWWSVDSTTWAKRSAYGIIIMPHHRGGRFVFDRTPYDLFIGDGSPYTKRMSSSQGMKHYRQMPLAHREVVRQWLKEIGVPFGKSKNGKVIVAGVSNDIVKRQAATVEYFERLVHSLPKWPWAFIRVPTMGFGLEKKDGKWSC